MDKIKLNKIAKQLSNSPKGILAADESNGTIKKRFDSIRLESSFENRRKFRELLFQTSNIEKYISGVILFDETIKQKNSDGISFVNLLKSKGIEAGIKVDAGAKKLEGSENEKITEGLDNLSAKIDEYKKLGASFTKWRAVIEIGNNKPSLYCIKLNSYALARYAKIVQEQGLVPIVEPEVLMDGSHTIDECFQTTKTVLKVVFEELLFNNVYLGGILLKPNMVISGMKCQNQSSVEEVKNQTLNCLKECVPDEVPGIVFLSGGQSNELATLHLNSMNKNLELPWNLSFSYGRALQQPSIISWNGKDENVSISQKNLEKRAKLNSLATTGDYNISMEDVN